MGKKKAGASKRKMRRLHYGREWPRVSQSFDDEIKPIVNSIKRLRLAPRVRIDGVVVFSVFARGHVGDPVGVIEVPVSGLFQSRSKIHARLPTGFGANFRSIDRVAPVMTWAISYVANAFPKRVQIHAAPFSNRNANRFDDIQISAFFASSNVINRTDLAPFQNA